MTEQEIARAEVVAAAKPPIPSPSSTETLSEIAFAVARSSLPSALKSPVVTERTIARAEVRRRREAAQPIAEQHRDVVGVRVCRRKVELAVGVEVARRHGARTIASAEVRHRSKAARPVAEQHRNVVRKSVRRRQVEFAVSVEVARRDGEGTIARTEVHRRCEAAGTVADKHRNVVGILVRRRQVEFAVGEIVKCCV